MSPVVVVTGAARGLGMAICELFVERGWRAVVADVDGDAAAATAQRLGAASAARCDVTDSGSVDELAQLVKRELGGVDVLVNNAGVVHPQPSHEVGDDDWDALLAVHLGGTFRVSRAFLPLLVRAGAPAVVNMSSVCASRGFPGRLSYNAAKAAIEALTRTLAVEWGVVGIRVNAVAPGFILTESSRRLYEAGVADAEARARLTVLGRLGRPEEIARAVFFLASEDAGYVTGQTLIVDGGYLVDGRTGPDPAVPEAAQLLALDSSLPG